MFVTYRTPLAPGTAIPEPPSNAHAHMSVLPMSLEDAILRNRMQEAERQKLSRERTALDALEQTVKNILPNLAKKPSSRRYPRFLQPQW